MTPLRKATTTAILRALTQQFIYRHSCSTIVISDNQFTSRQFEKFLADHKITHQTSSAYAPQCNPVERANRTIKTMVAQYVDKRQQRWDELLPQLQYAFNTARQEVTGITPAYLLHGWELARPHPADRRATRTTNTPETTHRLLEEAYDVVRTHLARAFQQQQSHYDLRRRAWRPSIRDQVWKRVRPLSDKARGFNAKLAPRYIGPMTVRRLTSPVNVDL
ncbi:uncharacterized protein [Anoplolepis gracilipes]|uniref:uncharacterized protein n=1 Tax=Anoplolepis gracilipes TaxID=354296 RepID=UPI003BA2169E